MKRFVLPIFALSLITVRGGPPKPDFELARVKVYALDALRKFEREVRARPGAHLALITGWCGMRCALSDLVNLPAWREPADATGKSADIMKLLRIMEQAEESDRISVDEVMLAVKGAQKSLIK